MAILDWFKEISLSAVLKERLVDLEKKLLILEKENAALNLTRCIGALIFSFINICIAYIPYYYQTFLKGVNP